MWESALLTLAYRINTGHKSLIAAQSHPAWFTLERCGSLESLLLPLFCEVSEGCTVVPNSQHTPSEPGAQQTSFARLPKGPVSLEASALFPGSTTQEAKGIF